ncbi:MAG: aminotransferase class IV, partial [Betaproteobacteria bacterium]
MLFETLRTHERNLPLLNEHLKRLKKSAAFFEIPMPSTALLARTIQHEVNRRLALQ